MATELIQDGVVYIKKNCIFVIIIIVRIVIVRNVLLW